MCTDSQILNSIVMSILKLTTTKSLQLKIVVIRPVKGFHP